MSLFENMKIYDKFGNMLLSKGLKVVHKKSGFVYTVHNVTRMGEDKNGQLMIILAPPEEPRIDVEEEFLDIYQEPKEKEEKEKIQKHDVISEKSILVCELDEREMYVEIPQTSRHKKVSPHTDRPHHTEEESLEHMQLSPGEFLAVPEDEFKKEYEVR